MAAAMKALLAAALARAASAAADPACSAAFNTFQVSVLTECEAAGSACGATCTQELQSVLTLCEGKKFENATGGVVEFEKATSVSGFMIFMSDACRAAATDIALAGGRCNTEDCRLASDLFGAASILDCQADPRNPELACASHCVTLTSAVYTRCTSSDAATTIAGANVFLSSKCKAVQNDCSFGVGCGGKSGTTTEAPSSGTTAEDTGDPEVCPPPSSTTAAVVSFSARAAALSLLALAPVAALLA